MGTGELLHVFKVDMDMIDIAEGETMKPEVLGPESEIYNKNNQIRPDDFVLTDLFKMP